MCFQSIDQQVYYQARSTLLYYCIVFLGYEKGNMCCGAIMGRVTNRIGNAAFTLDGEEYKLPQNDGPNCIHGGLKGFHKVGMIVQNYT